MDEAIAHLEAALEERMGARPRVAHTQLDLARMSSGAGTRMTRRAASSPFSASSATSAELGMTALSRRVAALQDVA